MSRTLRLLLLTLFAVTPVLGTAGIALAADTDKAKFYDFSDQLIDGEVKKPTVLLNEGRQRAKFEKLLKLKKSFRPAMIETSKERILK